MKKLTPDVVEKIRARKLSGASNAVIAKEFGVSTGSVVNAVQGNVGKPAQSAATKEHVETLKTLLGVQKARLKVAIGNEANSRKVSAQASTIAKEIERLTAEIARLESLPLPAVQRNPAPEPVRVFDSEIPPDATQDDIRRMLDRRSRDIEKLISNAKAQGDVGKYASLMRIANSLAQIQAKVTPVAPPKEESPDIVAAAEKCKERLRAGLARLLERLNAKPA